MAPNHHWVALSTMHTHTTQPPLLYTNPLLQRTQPLYRTQTCIKYTQATQLLYLNVAVKTPSYTQYTTNFDTLTIQPTPLGFDTANCCTGHRCRMVVVDLSPTWGWQLLRK